MARIATFTRPGLSQTETQLRQSELAILIAHLLLAAEALERGKSDNRLLLDMPGEWLKAAVAMTGWASVADRDRAFELGRDVVETFLGRQA